jgi:hypothetical protein
MLLTLLGGRHRVCSSSSGVLAPTIGTVPPAHITDSLSDPQTASLGDPQTAKPPEMLTALRTARWGWLVPAAVA